MAAKSFAAAPSTPKPRTSASPSANASTETTTTNESPGHWRHPQLREIVQRQKASIFSEKNVKEIIKNVIFLFATRFVADWLRKGCLWLGSWLDIPTHPDLLLLLIRFFLVCNIVVALYPIYGAKDTFNDIPLTPSQRALLGLNPQDSSPATPETEYCTPPRYRVSSSASRNSSPLSSPTSPFGSPLLNRGSYNSPNFRASTSSIPDRPPSPFVGSPSPSPLFPRSLGTPVAPPTAKPMSYDGRSSVLSSSLNKSSPFAQSFNQSQFSHSYSQSRLQAYPSKSSPGFGVNLGASTSSATNDTNGRPDSKGSASHSFRDSLLASPQAPSPSETMSSPVRMNRWVYEKSYRA